MIAQRPWLAWPRRLDAIVADGHPAPCLEIFRGTPPALKYFEVRPLPCEVDQAIKCITSCRRQNSIFDDTDDHLILYNKTTLQKNHFFLRYVVLALET